MLVTLTPLQPVGSVHEGRVVDVRIPIERLSPRRHRRDGIRREEPADHRVVHPTDHIDEAELIVVAVPGVSGLGACDRASVTEARIAALVDFVTVVVSHEHDRAKRISMKELPRLRGSTHTAGVPRDFDDLMPVSVDAEAVLDSSARLLTRVESPDVADIGPRAQARCDPIGRVIAHFDRLRGFTGTDNNRRRQVERGVFVDTLEPARHLRTTPLLLAPACVIGVRVPTSLTDGVRRSAGIVGVVGADSRAERDVPESVIARALVSHSSVEVRDVGESPEHVVDERTRIRGSQPIDLRSSSTIEIVRVGHVARDAGCARGRHSLDSAGKRLEADRALHAVPKRLTSTSIALVALERLPEERSRRVTQSIQMAEAIVFVSDRERTGLAGIAELKRPAEAVVGRRDDHLRQARLVVSLGRQETAVRPHRRDGLVSIANLVREGASPCEHALCASAYRSQPDRCAAGTARCRSVKRQPPSFAVQPSMKSKSSRMATICTSPRTPTYICPALSMKRSATSPVPSSSTPPPWMANQKFCCSGTNSSEFLTNAPSESTVSRR